VKSSTRVDTVYWILETALFANFLIWTFCFSFSLPRPLQRNSRIDRGCALSCVRQSGAQFFMFHEDPIYWGADSSWVFICLLYKQSKRSECRGFPPLPLSSLPASSLSNGEKKQQNRRRLLPCFLLFIKQLISWCRCTSRLPAMMANICWINCLEQRTGVGPPTSGWCRGVRRIVVKHLYPARTCSDCVTQRTTGWHIQFKHRMLRIIFGHSEGL